MRVTVCELNDQPEALAQDWERLVVHVKQENSQLVLLPEMPFYPWIANARLFEPATWKTAVIAHESWLARLASSF